MDVSNPPSPESNKIPPPAPHDGLSARLRTGREKTAALGPAFASHAERLRQLEDRLIQGRFHLAVLGQVKRGKSTLLNALLGEEILPSSVIPLTAIPTFIRSGEERHLIVRFNDSRPDAFFSEEPAGSLNTRLMAFVTESANPRNTKGVREVEITHPAAILREVVLIDTPGIGSTFRHNTESTLNFLPQCDAALFLISADPPITEGELEFLRTIRSRIGTIFFLLNKVDYLTPSEQETAVTFYRDVLVKSAGLDPAVKIFPVSARNGLKAKTDRDPALWQQSGLADVSDHLITFLAQEKGRVLQDAIRKKALDVLRDVQLQLNLSIRSCELPLEDLDRKLATFERVATDASQQRVHAQDILAGDKRRAQEALEASVKNLKQPLTERLKRIAQDTMRADNSTPEKAAEKALEEAIPAIFEHELGTIGTAVEADIVRRLTEHRRRADDLIESVRKSASELFDIPYHPPESPVTYELVRKPYWIEHVWENTISPVSAEFLDRMIPRALRKDRAEKRIGKQIDLLVMRNLENLRWETSRSVDESFKKFSAELDSGIARAVDATLGAIRSARKLREVKGGEAGATVSGLRRQAEDIAVVIRQLE
ncbi:MAG: GTPase Era [Methanoregula sp. PtaU1.Bin051]|nr:MAG: GTPase Era [Methanoregula sp. PtaU1.Bin051]